MKKSFIFILSFLMLFSLTACSVKSMHGLISQRDNSTAVDRSSGLAIQNSSLAGRNKVVNVQGLTAGGQASAQGDGESEELPFNLVERYGVLYQSDWYHIQSDYAKMGDGELLTVTIDAAPAGLNEDDFIIYYDEAMLSVVGSDVDSDEQADTTTLTFDFKALGEGDAEILIVSLYDYCLYGEDVEVYEIPVYCYGPVDGKKVYVTPTGEKYHYSAECAGDNSMALTRSEAESYEYKPCGTCAR